MRLQWLENNKITHCKTEPKFDMNCDVCVVGLGTAGALSAISAAENGARVIGVERTAFLGGMGTASCVYDYYYGTQGGIVVPINEECYDRINSGKYATSGGRSFRDEALPSAVKDNVLREKALAAGCKLMLLCSAVAVYMDGESVCGVRISDGQKLINIGCKVLIDGTEGVVCRLAGCDFEYGRKRDGHTIKFSHLSACFLSGRVRGNWRVFGFPEVENAKAWTRLILESSPEYNGSRVVCEGSVMGTREVPTVITDEVYTLEDYAKGKKTDKPLLYGFSKVDNLNSDFENENVTLQDWEFLCKMGRFGISVGISASNMLPKGKDGLLIVSRAKGLGHDMASCMRMKFDLEKCGEAAGCLAALACLDGVSLREVDYEKLKGKLISTSCLNYSHDIGICDLNEPYRDPQNGLLWRAIELPRSAEEYKKVLSSKEPGPAMWLLRNNCSDEMCDNLIEWMNGEERLLAENCALILAMRGEKIALPMLRDIISKEAVGHYYCVPKVKNIFGWLMESPFCNFSKAILLLGRLCDRESLARLNEILKDGARSVTENMIADDNFPDKEKTAAEICAYARVAVSDIENFVS